MEKSDPKPFLSDKVVLSVSGKKFTMNPSIFLKHPETMLGSLHACVASVHTVLTIDPTLAYIQEG